jgi:hypothetical protein
VYVAAWVLDEGESFADIYERKAIPPDRERYMATRAGAQPIEVDASHSIALSQPKAVADLIRTAVTDVSTKTTTA